MLQEDIASTPGVASGDSKYLRGRGINTTLSLFDKECFALVINRRCQMLREVTCIYICVSVWAMQGRVEPWRETAARKWGHVGAKKNYYKYIYTLNVTPPQFFK